MQVLIDGKVFEADIMDFEIVTNIPVEIKVANGDFLHMKAKVSQMFQDQATKEYTAMLSYRLFKVEN